MTATVAEAIAAARAWMDQDPDPVTRAELDQLVIAAHAGDTLAGDNLVERFSGRLEFGTAGLRGALGAGPMRMNRVLVAQAAAGLGAYLLDASVEGRPPTVVIGYDARTNSERFARDSAEILAGAGLSVTLLPRALPTPVLAFAVRHLGTDAGVMVTASHNPPQDNGYKVYLGGPEHDGSQIVPPADADIAARIEQAAAGPISGLPRSDSFVTAGEDVVDAYVAAAAAVAGAVPAQLTVVYTALHGVGYETAAAVFARAGFDPVIPVPAQRDPDPVFPTVDFPNPEEPGAMDLSYRLADESGAELVIAHDPDADRLAVAIPTDSGWRRLTGNEVGGLLAWWCAERNQRSADPGGTLASSLVSSPSIAAVAKHYRLDYTQTLTGFKWISRAPGLLFGFEEALGYLVNPADVRDKDGISAAVAFLALASAAKAAGRTIADRLAEFATHFGAFASGQISIRVEDLSRIDAVLAHLRENPPSAIGAVEVSGIDDLRDGWEGLPPADVLRIHLADGSRVIVRPSGTEPKLKVYLDTVGGGDDGASVAANTLSSLERDVRALIAQADPQA